MVDRFEEMERLSAFALLVSGVAHDLSNPLTGIQGYTEIVRRKEPGLSERGKDRLDLVGGMVRECEGMIRSLVRYARREEPSRGPIDPNELIRVVRGIMTQQLVSGAISIEVDVDFGSGIGPINGDALHLQEGLLHLVNGSIEAIERGTGEGRIELRTESCDGGVWIEVLDDAPRNDSEQEQRRTAISRKIFGEFGGTLSIESRPGAGRRARVEMPSVGEPSLDGPRPRVESR